MDKYRLSAASLLVAVCSITLFAQSYKIVGTGQTKFYNNTSEISAPTSGQAFFGQDANYQFNKPSYKDNGDGTITDLNTGLMWQKSVGTKVTYQQAVSGAAAFNLAGYKDWRLPSIKELYSLIVFSGIDPSGYNGTSTSGLTPFIDTKYFDFKYGDTSTGERIIDAQYCTSTKYVTTTMINDETDFGVNFADGRIKGYGLIIGGSDKTFFVKYVRGSSNYGKNEFKNNGNGTITDNATGLMWSQNDFGKYNWEEALNLVQQKNKEKYLGYDDWRLPSVKELQSIIDYTRSPKTNNSAAIDPMFNCTQITNESGVVDYPYYWSSTTHANMQSGNAAAYISFGRAMGYMNQWLDVHGAGAQRSDPKSGNPSEFPFGRGPQGDAIRIYNYVRLVRNVSSATDINQNESQSSPIPDDFKLFQNYPNPFNPSTTIEYSIPAVDTKFASTTHVTLKVYDVLGNEISTLVDEYKSPGLYAVSFSAGMLSLASGIYHYRLRAGNYNAARKMILLK